MTKYDFKLSPFTLPAEKAKLAFKSGASPDYSVITKAFGESLGQDLGRKNKATNTTHTVLTLYCRGACKKSYKVSIKNTDIKSADSDIICEVYSQTATPCSCIKVPAQIRGSQRNALKKKLQEHSVVEVSRRIIDDEVLATDAQLKNIQREMRREIDLDPDDDINDALLRYRRQDPDSIKEVALYKSADSATTDPDRFRMIFVWDKAIELLKEFLGSNLQMPFKRLLVDATGKVTRSVNGERQILHHVLLLPYPKTHETCFLVPLGEMVTDDQTGENIGHFVRFVLRHIPAALRTKIRQIGTDDSWANVHAIFSLTPGMSILRYMDLAYDVFVGKTGESVFFQTTAPAYCFSHFSKNWANAIKVAYGSGKEKESIRNKVRGALQKLTNISDPQILESSINSFIALVGSKIESADSLKALEEFDEDQASQPMLQAVQETEPVENHKNDSMYKKSKFYQHFVKSADSIRENQMMKGKQNPYYSDSLLKHILKHYLPYLPFWTIFISTLQENSALRSNNARVEKHFRDLKDACEEDRFRICRLGGIKVGRYAVRRHEVVVAELKKIDRWKLSQVPACMRGPMPPGSSKSSKQIRSPKSADTEDLSQHTEGWHKGRRQQPKDFIPK